MKAVFDTNILIDYLNGIEEAKLELKKYNTKIISIITWIEVLVGAKNDIEEQVIKDFLYQFKLIYLDIEISKRAILLKKQKKIKLPDAIILATAMQEEVYLITRNTKDFSVEDSFIKVPY